MANNPYVNKVDTADGVTIMDITDTTATESDVLSGKVFYKASGARSTGSVDLSEKADKVSGATSGNFAGLDSNGNLTDSGSKASDFLTSHQDISGKADKADTVLTTTLSRGRKSGTTVGTGSIAFGDTVTASASFSVATGKFSVASGAYSHAEGDAVTSSGVTTGCTASGTGSHAEGCKSTASGDGAHSEGYETTASGNYSHSQGENTTASGTDSHAEGVYTIANHKAQHVFGKYNVADASTAAATTFGNYIEIVGNGSGSTRSNARSLDWNGNERLKGDLYIGCGTDSSGGTKVATWSSIYPVGSVYMCANSNNPATLFGGTWVEFGIRLTWNDVENGTRSYTDGTGTGTLHFWRRTA